MKLLALFAPEMHILICTHSNNAANLYVEGLHMEWNSEWKGDRWRVGREREGENEEKWGGGGGRKGICLRSNIATDLYVDGLHMVSGVG